MCYCVYCPLFFWPNSALPTRYLPHYALTPILWIAKLSLLGERFTSLGLVHPLVLLRAKISIPAANCRRIVSNLYFRSDKKLNHIAHPERIKQIVKRTHGQDATLLTKSKRRRRCWTASTVWSKNIKHINLSWPAPAPENCAMAAWTCWRVVPS